MSDGRETAAAGASHYQRRYDEPPATITVEAYLVAEAGKRVGLGHVHPHMLRHSCGHALADRGIDTRQLQDWLGHRDIRHTAWYTCTSAKRFEQVWS